MSSDKLHGKTKMYDLMVMFTHEQNSIISMKDTHKLIEDLFENGEDFVKMRERYYDSNLKL